MFFCWEGLILEQKYHSSPRVKFQVQESASFMKFPGKSVSFVQICPQNCEDISLDILAHRIIGQ